jgi:hypothetical protein
MKKIGLTIALHVCVVSLGLWLAGCQADEKGSGGNGGAAGSGGGGGSGGSGGGGSEGDMGMTIPDMAAPSQPELDMAMMVPSSDMAETPDANGVSGASVRFINASSARLTGKDAHMQYSFDIYLAGSSTPLASNVMFGQCSSWISVVTGQAIKFDLRQAGDPATAAPLFTTADADALTLSAGGQASVIIYNYSKTTTGGFKLLNLTDGFTQAASGATARFVNVAPANSAYKVYLDPNGAPTVQVMPNAATPASGQALPAGAPVPILIANGVSTSSMFPASGDATWTLPASLVANGKQLLLIVTGQGLAHPRDPDSVRMIVVDEKLATQVLNQDPLLFVVGASPTAPALDLTTPASQVKLAGLQYKQLMHLSLPAGGGAAIAGASGGTALFSSPTGALTRGERYLAVVAGLMAAPGVGPDQALQLRVYQEQFMPAAAMTARLRVINASPTAPALDVGIYYAPTVLTPVQAMTLFPQASPAAGTQTMQKPSGMPTLSVGVGPNGNAAATLSFAYPSQFDVDDPLFVIPAGDWGAAATASAKKTVFVKAPIKSAWQASAPN